MKRVLLIIFSTVLIGSLFVIFSLQNIFSKSEYIHKEAIMRAKSDYDINKVIKTSTYNGKKQYIAIEALKKNNKKIYVLVPVKGEEMYAYRSSQGISKKKALEIVKREDDVQKVIKIQLGMEEDNPLWEITYINDNGNYSYYYVNFEDGTFFKRYSL
ncbi:MAG: peptidase propeptide and domain protein [Bacillales bacterium]|nr:peptidase propeptide and domain protein [Bacillales bacterium]